jgi:hypothetical protein
MTGPSSCGSATPEWPRNLNSTCHFQCQLCVDATHVAVASFALRGADAIEACRGERVQTATDDKAVSRATATPMLYPPPLRPGVAGERHPFGQCFGLDWFGSWTTELSGSQWHG